MKTFKNYFIAAIVIIACQLFAADSFANSKAAIKGDTVIIPENVRTTFQTKYPHAQHVTWYTYSDLNDDYIDAYPNFYDTSNYYVVYDVDNNNYTTWYTPQGEWVMTTNTIQSDKLPPAALKTLQSSYNGYTVKKVDEDHYNGGVRYDVKLEKGSEKIKIHITADGQVLKFKDKQ